MSELLPYLDPASRGAREAAGDYAQLRLVPFQPAGIALGLIYMGAELGNLPWAGTRPNAGDTVAVIGHAGERVVIPRVQSPQRDPIFGDRCVCRCPGSSTGGLVFVLNDIFFTTMLLVVDGETGTVVYTSTLPEVIGGGGLAVDPAAPHDLYILDNRQGTQNLTVDSEIQPDPDKQWYFMLKYTLSGGAYTFSTAEIMPGYPDRNPFDDERNSLAVIDGVCWIACAGEPATLRQWSGSGFTELVLTLDGVPYVAQLLGPVVQVTARPAPTSSYFVLAWIDETTYELLQFNAAGEIQGRMQDAELTHPTALITVCNRLMIFQGQGTSRSDDFPEPDPGDDDDEGEGGGEEQ